MPKTDNHHFKRRFSMPIISIALFMGVLLIFFFLLNIDSSKEEPLPEKIDIFLYENLGITPGTQKIGESEQIYSRDEIMETKKAEALIKEYTANPLISNLKPSTIVEGFNKKATVFSIIGEAAEKRTLVEIRFKAGKDAEALKIIESIPKSTAVSEEILLTKEGVLAEKDPVIIFTFYNVKAEETLKAVYAVKKEIKRFETATFAAEEEKPAYSEEKICGDGRCVEGENYRTCCTDCGCLPGFSCERYICVNAAKDLCTTSAECDDNDETTADTCSGKPKRCIHANIPICDSSECKEDSALEGEEQEGITRSMTRNECGSDFDCFIESANNCMPARISSTIDIETDIGMTQTTKEQYEILGMQEESCSFYLKVDSINLAYSQETKEAMISDGYSQEEIEYEEQMINQQADSFEGAEGYCEFKTQDLVSMLTRWKNKEFSDSDWSNAVCEGAYFQ